MYIILSLLDITILYIYIYTKELHFLWFYFCVEKEGGRERKRNTNLLSHILTHSLVGSCVCPDQWSGHWAHNLGGLGWYSSQLSYPARAVHYIFGRSVLFLDFFHKYTVAYWIEVKTVLCTCGRKKVQLVH